MSWQQWVIIATYLASIITIPLRIDEPREPITPGLGALSIAISVLFIVLVATI